MDCRPLRFQHKKYFGVLPTCGSRCIYWKICMRCCKTTFDEEERDRIEASYDEKQFIGKLEKRVWIRNPGTKKVWAENRKKYLPKVRKMLGKYKYKDIADKLGIELYMVKKYVRDIKKKKYINKNS